MSINTTQLVFDETDNLLRVFQLPETVSADFCMPDGHQTNFLLVDWFRPSSEVGQIIDVDKLRQFIRTKIYYQSDRNYLVMLRTGETFLVDPPITALSKSAFDVTEDEKKQILQRRQHEANLKTIQRQRLFALETAAKYEAWLQENNRGSTFSTFVDEFGYQAADKLVFGQVEAIRLAAVIK
ncbi:MAG: hypothetical protein K9L79_00450 [Methylobacter tundripaludum]|nr:hypothetical protein [Methylobacter tundripaludum]